MTALQRMLVQYDGDEIYLLPAWPKDWNTEFRLHAPGNTMIDCKVENGKIASILVTPESRRKDLFIAPQFKN